MHTLFLLNPAAGKGQLPAPAPCRSRSRLQLPVPGLPRRTTPSALPPTLATPGTVPRAAAAAAQKGRGGTAHFTAGGDGTFKQALTVPTALIRPPWAACPMAARQRLSAHLRYKGRVSGSGRPAGRRGVPIDLMRTSLGLSATICAASLDAQVAYSIPKFAHPAVRRRGSPMRCPLSGGCGHIGRRVEYVIDGEVLTVDCLMCAVCNGRATAAALWLGQSTAG